MQAFLYIYFKKGFFIKILLIEKDGGKICHVPIKERRLSEVMTTKEYNVSSQRITYGFAGAQYPNLESALSMARHLYRLKKDELGDELKETYDQALVEEENSVYLKMTRVVKE